VAAELKSKLSVDAELLVGTAGEFTVWVDDAKVAEKGFTFPDPKVVVEAVRAKLAP